MREIRVYFQVRILSVLRMYLVDLPRISSASIYMFRAM